MSGCVNMRFGFNNRLPYATLSSSPSADTPLDYMKDEYPARMTVWDKTNLDGNIVINGTFPVPQYSEFMALPGVKKIGDIEVNLELYLAPDNALDLLVMPFEPVRKYDLTPQIPLGDWVAGVDEYGGSLGTNIGLIPDTFVYWFGKRVYYDSFKLTIRRAADSTEVLEDARMRMLFLGDMLELETNFSYGHTMTFLNKPSLIQTASGSWTKSKRQVRSRKLELMLNQMGSNDYNALQQLESVLLGDPFVISAMPSSNENWKYNNYNMLARFYDELEFTHRYQDIFRTPVTLVEV